MTLHLYYISTTFMILAVTITLCITHKCNIICLFTVEGLPVAETAGIGVFIVAIVLVVLIVLAAFGYKKCK